MTGSSRLTLGVIGIIGLVCLAAAAPAAADAVTTWNGITLGAVTAGRPGPPGTLDVALVHAAVYDAVQAFDGRYEPYHVAIANASGAPEAAVAAAAHGVLVALYPGQQDPLDEALLNFLTENDLLGDPGLAVGEQAAEAILPLYRAAPNPPLPPFNGGDEPGEWRPTPSYIGSPPNPLPFSPMAFLFLGSIDPYTLIAPSQFRPQPPPPLASEVYRRDFDEVKAFGYRFSTARTAEQTDLAYFWSENFVAQWHRALRSIAEAHVDDLGDSARLFALASFAMADAAITAWESKYHFNFWRPVTAIQEGDDDGNPKTTGEPTWEPLINTPPYPDYTSGANNLTGAVTTILQHFFGTDEFSFTVTSNSPLVIQNTRNFTRFSDAAQEVVEARILLGIHFRFADTAARRQGSRVASWVFRNYLRPLPGSQ